MKARAADLPALLGFLVLCFAVSAGGGAITATSVGTWYQALAKPAFTPPDWVFAPVWSTLYLLMAIAAWRVWLARAEPAARGVLVLFFVQLALNLAWSAIFFGLQRPGWALIELTILVVLVALTARAFWILDRLAGALMAPYVAWALFALALNFEVWRLN